MQPLRMCVACRQMLLKEQLTRVVKSAGEIKIDRTYKAEGRGAYLCFKPECLARCKKARLLNKAFKTAVPDSVYSELEGFVKE